MARPREPIDLIIAKEKKHLTKAEIEERRAQEVKVEFKDVKPPDYLPKKLAEEFMEIADKLLQIGIITELDEDTLAMYVLSKQNYLQYTRLLKKYTRSGNIDEAGKAMQMQDKAFKQALACARELGLTISSRCRLAVPKTEEEPTENKFTKFKKGQNYA